MILTYLLESDTGKKEKSHEPKRSLIYQIPGHAQCETLYAVDQSAEMIRCAKARAGLDDVRSVDKTQLLSRWIKSMKKQLGATGWIKVLFEIIHL